MRAALFLMAFWSSSALAAHLSMLSVGDFGGFRVKGACFFGGAARLCTLDTMGSVSVIPSVPDFASYKITGHEKVSGIGTELDCDVVDVNDLEFLDQKPAHFYPLRCGEDNSAFPLIGLPFLDGRVFQLNFPASELEWDAPAAEPHKLIRIGGEKLWLALPATFAGEKVVVAFDTGNPVTIVNRAFVDAHPANFRPSTKPISPSLLKKGLVPFDVITPIVVAGVELKADYVYAGSGYPALFFEDAAIILGMNHAAPARWWFDLERDLFGVAPR